MVKKVGILINEDARVAHWQQRIIKGIQKDKRFELSLILEDGLYKKEIFKKNRAQSFMSFLLSIQKYLERKLLRISDRSLSLPDLIDYQNLASCLTRFSTIKKSDSRVFLYDVVLDFSQIPHKSEYIKISKNGIWKILFRDIEQQKSGPIGFWEVLEREEGIGAVLGRVVNKGPDSYEILNTSFFNRGWSITETKNVVCEGAVSMVFKELNQIFFQQKDTVPHQVFNPINNKTPDLWSLLKYLGRFYSFLFFKVWEKFANSVLKIRPEKWSLFLGNGVFETSILEKLKPAPMPKDEFWADPFLFEYKGNEYVFFENYSYHSKKGKISCGRIIDDTLADISDVLVKDYHLSFPYIFRDGDNVYLMPETCGNKRLELYKAIHFPDSWELYSTAFDGELVADPFFYTDDDNQRWLFLNKQMDESAPMNSELFIYKVDSLKLDMLSPHKKNPVLIDARVARNGGPTFKLGNTLYRPSQRNIDGIYGRALNINRIKKLTLEDYEEEIDQVCLPTFQKNLIAMHHLHQTSKRFVIDAAYKNSNKV